MKISGSAAATPMLAALGVLTVVLAMTTGCSAEPPAKAFDAGLPADTTANLDLPPTGCPATPTVGAPTVTPPPDPTFNARQPIRGYALGASHITATGGAGNSGLTKVGTDGSFCLEVRLIEDAQNTITLIPLDSRGCPGNVTTITLTHRTQASADGGVAPTISNVAANAPITASVVPDDNGVLAAINDAKPQTFAKLSFYDFELSGKCDKFAWVRVDLGKVYTVSRLKVAWAANAGDDYGKCYSILLSSKQSPADPDPSSGDWIVASSATDGKAEDQVLDINPESARWAALLLYENAASWYTEAFKIAELEVWGQDPNAVPPPPPESCN